MKSGISNLGRAGIGLAAGAAMVAGPGTAALAADGPGLQPTVVCGSMQEPFMSSACGGPQASGDLSGILIVLFHGSASLPLLGGSMGPPGGMEGAPRPLVGL